MARRPRPAIPRPPRTESPDALDPRARLPLVELDPAPLVASGRMPPPTIAGNSYLRAYRLGECSVIVTRELGGFHLSIAHPRRLPTWIEASQAWYRVIPDAGKGRVGALLLPDISEYVNLHKYCIQVVEVARDRAGRVQVVGGV